MNLNQSLKEYFNELSSNSPTPGGGNVAALCGALSASLGTMVCNLTIGKKKYTDVEAEINLIKGKLENYQKKFFELAAKDNEAFDKVMAAFKLPKESDAEKELRSQKIEEATIHAAEVPSVVIKNCSELLPLVKIVVEKGNRNSLSDAGVSVLLIDTAAKAAYLNVLINCASLSNQTIANEIKKGVEILVNEITKETSYIFDKTIKAIQPV